MSKIDDGGPAFPWPPVPDPTEDTMVDCGSRGMSLRDYFAAEAMHAILSDFRFREACAAAAHSLEEQMAVLARCAYQHADAMLVARQKARPQ